LIKGFGYVNDSLAGCRTCCERTAKYRGLKKWGFLRNAGIVESHGEADHGVEVEKLIV
jgi:hypothetical protein